MFGMSEIRLEDRHSGVKGVYIPLGPARVKNELVQSIDVKAIDWIVSKCTIEIRATLVLLRRVSGWPSSGGGVVISVAVVIKARLPIVELGGEHEGVDLGHWAGGADDFAEGAILVFCREGCGRRVRIGGGVASGVVVINVCPGVGPRTGSGRGQSALSTRRGCAAVLRGRCRHGTAPLQAAVVRMGPAVGSVRTCRGGVPAGGVVLVIESGGQGPARGGNRALPPDRHVASVVRHHSASVVREGTVAARRGFVKEILQGDGESGK